MDLQILFSLILFFLSLSYQLTKLRSSGTQPTNNKLPQQPWKLPVIGHLHHLIESLLHRSLGKLSQKLGPNIHLQLGEFSTVVISSPSLAKQVIKTNDLSFASRPKLLSVEIVGYKMRKICILELLSAKKVRSFKSVHEQESRKMIEFICHSINVNEGPVMINFTYELLFY